MTFAKLDSLYHEYVALRNLDINKEQFIYLVNLMPACIVALSDGIIDEEEWATVKSITKILGDEFATEDLGAEKEENLMLIYRGEMRYLIRHTEWQERFMDVLQEYFLQNDASKDFVEETIDLFTSKGNADLAHQMKKRLDV